MKEEILRFAQNDRISFINDNRIPAFAGMTGREEESRFFASLRMTIEKVKKTSEVDENLRGYN